MYIYIYVYVNSGGGDGVLRPPKGLLYEFYSQGTDINVPSEARKGAEGYLT